MRFFKKNTQIGYYYSFNDTGIWIIPKEKRISVFWNKKYFLGKLFIKSFWHQWNNASIAQRSLYPKHFFKLW